MYLSQKKLNQIRLSNLYVRIEYQTKHSKGYIEFKGLFFMEKYSKILKLLKDTKIVSILITNDVNGLAITYTKDLFNTWLYLLGRKENEL